MKSLLLVAHGSRREASNQEVRDLANSLANQAGDTYQDVSAAFLELAEPSIPDGILAALERGASEIVVLPYFLSAGRHVAEDIPGEVDKARRLRPEADVRIAPYLGSSEALVRLLADLADAG